MKRNGQGQIKTCRRKQHVKTDGMKGISNLFCGIFAVGGNYNLTRDNIPMEESFKEEVSIMCNLSQGIKEAGIAEGREAGIAEGREAGIVEGKQREIEKVVLNMHKKGYSLEQIMDATELEEIELKSMIKKLK